MTSHGSTVEVRHDLMFGQDSTNWTDTAFFEDSQNIFFGLPDRPEFEARLISHWEYNTVSQQDLAWYALRNAIFAVGCQIELRKAKPTGLANTNTQAWQFFENAMSVHTELLYAPSNTTAIQALIIMVWLPENP